MRKQLGYLPGTEPHYTPRQRLETWFYYYKWWLLAGILVLMLLLPVFRNLLGIGVVEPDYRVACVTAGGISEEAARELTDAMETLGQDLNGDGQVRVELVQHRTGIGDQETAFYFSYASSITIQADLQMGDSHFFLMDDPERFQLNYQALADGDGKLPEEENYSAQGRFVPLSQLQLSLSENVQRELEPLFFGQRGYYEEEKVPNLSAYWQMWNDLTEERSDMG